MNPRTEIRLLKISYTTWKPQFNGKILGTITKIHENKFKLVCEDNEEISMSTLKDLKLYLKDKYVH